MARGKHKRKNKKQQRAETYSAGETARQQISGKKSIPMTGMPGYTGTGMPNHAEPIGPTRMYGTGTKGQWINSEQASKMNAALKKEMGGRKYGYDAMRKTWSGISGRAKLATGGVGIAAGMLTYGQMGRSKDSPISTGLFSGAIGAGTVGFAGHVLPGMATGKNAMIKSKGTKKFARTVGRAARKTGMGKAAMVAGGAMAGLGLARNVIGI